MTMTHNKSRSLYTSYVLLLHMALLLLPLASGIASTESDPEYNAVELSNGTILIYEPSSSSNVTSTTYTNVSQAAALPDNATTTTGQEQPAFVYTESDFGLDATSSINGTTTTTSSSSQNASFDFVEAEWGDEYNANNAQGGTPNKNNNNNKNGNGNKWKNKNNNNNNKNGNDNKKNSTNSSGGYSFGQEGYLVKQDPTVVSEPATTDGEWNYGQQGYPVREDPTVDSGTGSNNNKNKTMNATASDSDYSFSQQGYLEQEDSPATAAPTIKNDDVITYQQAGFLVEEGDLAVDPEQSNEKETEDGPGSAIADAMMAYLGNQVDKAEDGGNRRYLRGA